MTIDNYVTIYDIQQLLPNENISLNDDDFNYPLVFETENYYILNIKFFKTLPFFRKVTDECYDLIKDPIYDNVSINVDMNLKKDNSKAAIYLLDKMKIIFKSFDIFPDIVSYDENYFIINKQLNVLDFELSKENINKLKQIQNA